MTAAAIWDPEDPYDEPYVNPFDENDQPELYAAEEKRRAAEEDHARGQRQAQILKRATDEQLLRLRAQEAAKQALAEEQAATARAALTNNPRVIKGGSFLLDVPDLPPAIWGKGEDILWARGEALLIAGPQGTGKTTLAGQLLRAALGLGSRELLGLEVTPNIRRGLYLAMDRPKQTQRTLGRMFHEEERDFLDELLTFWVGPPPADIAANPETLVNLARDHDADMVFVDSLKDAAVGLAKDEVGAGYNRARQLALAEGIEIVELHHMVKNSPDGKAPRHLKDIFGSVWITAGVGSVLLLWGEAGDPVVEVHHLKQPMNEVGPLFMNHNRETGGTDVWHDPDADVVAVARAKGRAGIDAQAAAKALYGTDKPSRAQTEKARRKLADYTAKGLLVALGDASHGGRGLSNRWVAAVPDRWKSDDEERGERYR